MEAYHREVGREATASIVIPEALRSAYHREVGREATALQVLSFSTC